MTHFCSFSRNYIVKSKVFTIFPFTEQFFDPCFSALLMYASYFQIKKVWKKDFHIW